LTCPTTYKTHISSYNFRICLIQFISTLKLIYFSLFANLTSYCTRNTNNNYYPSPKNFLCFTKVITLLLRWWLLFWIVHVTLFYVHC
jgi:hypothetical protein